MTRPRGQGMLRAMRVGVRLGLSWVLCALACPACNSGTETGNPSLTGALSYTGYSSKPADFSVRDGGSVANIETAWLDLDSVSVSPDGDCGIEGGEAFLVPALGVGDHAAGAHNFTPFAAKAGAFCSVELPFARVPSDAAGGNLPDDLLGNSLLITGTLADGTPFSIASSATPVVELRAEAAGFALSADQPDAVIAFDFAAWLDGIDFDAAERSDGQIVISPDLNSSLLATFEQNLAAGVALYRDRDGDGLIDVDAELLARSQ
ncbi:MAG TPA: hypothetical protein VHP33_01285 [Polyangiaceae bacterium]|nr:hypothetical protein [Polyangiaceae bacterium]